MCCMAARRLSTSDIDRASFSFASKSSLANPVSFQASPLVEKGEALPEIRLSHGTGISSWFQHEVRRRQPDPRGVRGCLTTSLLALTKTAALSDSKRLTNQVIGIVRPFAIACSVVREGEIPPFSTLDSMPIDRFVAAARSLTFMPCRVRKARTSRPIALCKNGSLALVTAIVFWLCVMRLRKAGA